MLVSCEESMPAVSSDLCSTMGTVHLEVLAEM